MSAASTWIAGHPALDFANTVGGIRSGEHEEQLRDYGDLLEWAAVSKVCDEQTVLSLAAIEASRPQEAAAVLQEAWQVREVIHRAFLAVTRKEPIKPADLGYLSHILSEAHSNLAIAPAGEAFALDWLRPPSLSQPIKGAVRATAELLISGPLQRVKVCAATTCGWLFLDSSKSGSRQWCDMAVCGNRHKVARYKQRVRSILRDGSA